MRFRHGQGGIALSHLPGLPMVAGAAIGIGAMTAGMLQLPMTAVLLTTLFLGTDGIKVMPLVIVAVVMSFVLSKWLAGPPPAGPRAICSGRAPAGPLTCPWPRSGGGLMWQDRRAAFREARRAR